MCAGRREKARGSGIYIKRWSDGYFGPRRAGVIRARLRLHTPLNVDPSSISRTYTRIDRARDVNGCACCTHVCTWPSYMYALLAWKCPIRMWCHNLHVDNLPISRASGFLRPHIFVPSSFGWTKTTIEEWVVMVGWPQPDIGSKVNYY